ncbi:HNH endonuclease [Alkalicoccobacillus gibsonii]|uniref:HNH endonuclease n=1 Tax=Alkalicoccobacillus gibsonii TaxID=79881 RepID=UPI001933D9B6|nr:HNH endonuclease [Alkalicoccobacillus gibsonii]MBM0064771.1 HNH endonuclease [Alkalicoccobacillus gibsonii]
MSKKPEYKTRQQKQKFYKSSAWRGNKSRKGVRQLALERDNYECQECKRNGLVHVDSKKIEGERKSIELNVHHLKEIYTHPELALELDNTETLCLDCHNIIHDRTMDKLRKIKEERENKPKTKKKVWDDERWD